MKTITTSKGEFVACNFSKREENALKISGVQTDEIKLICKLSKATEEDAELIVDKSEAFQLYRNYLKTVEFGNKMEFTSPIESFHSLLKSKGIDFKNGNWYLFEKLK